MKTFKEFMSENYMGKGGDVVLVQPKGKLFVLISDKNSDMIDMEFETIKDALDYAKKKKLVYKSASAKKVLKLLDGDEDGQSKYMEFVKKVSKEDKISVKHLEKELEPFI